MTAHSSAVLCIKKNHVLESFATSLIVADPRARLLIYDGFSDLLVKLRPVGTNSKIIFYVPEFYLLLVIFRYYLKFNFYYFVHEPRISLSRSPSVKFFFVYKLWLFLISLSCNPIFLSFYGSSLGRVGKKRPIVIPLLFDNPSHTLALDCKKEKKFDVVMWGSLNTEKGLDRFISFASAFPNLSFGVLARKNARLVELKESLTKLPNLDWALREDYIPDLEIFKFVQSGKVAFLCQRESTQSAQLPLALSLGLPVVTTDCGSFPEFIGTAKFSRCFFNGLSDDALSKELGQHIPFILSNLSAASEEASEFYSDNFDPRMLEFADWSNQL